MNERSEEPPLDRGPDDTILGPSRRTVLASERTWLAWFRTGIAVSAAAIAVGGVIPHLVDGARWPFVVLGLGYAVLASAVFIYGFRRHREIRRALDSDAPVPAGDSWMLGLTLVGALLALGTLLMVLIDA